MPVAGSSKRDACKTEACAIQDCLAKNDYDMHKCKDKVDKLKDCCSKNLKESVHCGMIDSEPTQTLETVKSQMIRYALPVQCLIMLCSLASVIYYTCCLKCTIITCIFPAGLQRTLLRIRLLT